MLDLILTKMGRGDVQDLEDIRNMMRLEYWFAGQLITGHQIETAARTANVPTVYGEIFPAARDRIITFAHELEKSITDSW